MASHGIGSAVRLAGRNAWEWDFKDPSARRQRQPVRRQRRRRLVHGPRLARRVHLQEERHRHLDRARRRPLGQRDLEWLQLESCQVLADTNGTHDYFGRWRQAFDGPAHPQRLPHQRVLRRRRHRRRRSPTTCSPRSSSGGRCGRRTRVRNAWAAMAIDREPNGVVYRSMGLVAPGRGDQHRRLLLGPGQHRTRHRTHPEHGHVGDHRHGLTNNNGTDEQRGAGIPAPRCSSSRPDCAGRAAPLSALPVSTRLVRPGHGTDRSGQAGRAGRGTRRPAD